MSNIDPLKRKLEAWQVEPRFRPDFNREVWKKIAAKETAREQAFWPGLIATLFVQPRYAMALVMASLSISLGAAHLHSRNTNLEHWTMLEERYVQSIDPIAKAAMKQ